MPTADRFEDLIDSLAGFHRTWLIHLGLELGLLEQMRAAGSPGIEPDSLAAACGCAPDPVRAWAIAADAHEIVTFDGERLHLADDMAAVLLEPDRPEYLGGHLSHAVVASLDHWAMPELFRSGAPVAARPDRYRVSIERLTRQDIAVFFQEALGALPEVVAELSAGASVVDLHCGGGRWLIAMAQRFPGLRLLGIEFERDSVERARRTVAAAGLGERISIVLAEIADIDRGVGSHDLAYFQYALHDLADPVTSLAAGWSAVRPGGHLLVLDWCAPSDLDDYRTAHGRLVSAIQLDELFQGTRLRTLEEFLGIYEAAGVPAPDVVELPSGATLLVVRRDD